MEQQHVVDMTQSAHYQEALQLHQSGNIQQAIQHYQATLEKTPSDAQLMYLLGTAYCQNRELDQAIDLLNQSLALSPHNAFAHNNLGNAYQEKNHKEQALQCYQQAIRIKPDYVSAFYNQGNLLNALGRQQESLSSYAEAIRLQPNYLEALREYASLLRDMGNAEQALEIFAQAILVNHHNADVHFQKAITLKKLGRVYQAIESYLTTIQVDPKYISAHFNLGNLYLDLGENLSAFNCYSKALELKPDNPEAYLNRGNVLKSLRRMQEALNDYSAAININPNYADAYSNRGNLHKDNGRVEPALRDYEKALELRPNYAEVQWNKALLLIVKGDYLPGWELYEWRLRMSSYQVNCQKFPQPEWRDLSEITGKTVLVYAEQGYGDAIQFCRYLIEVKNHCQHLIAQVNVALIPLLNTLAKDIQFIAKGETLPQFDMYCPLMSLPFIYKTTLDTIPAAIPYLYADQARVNQWRNTLPSQNSLRVGLVWTGSAKHENDINRSIPLNQLLPLMQLQVEWHSLQKEYRIKDQAALKQCPQLQHHQKDLNDFADTAALIECMDLVITVDTSVAHLAGAMGKPVWVLLPFAPDYRWLLEREDSPWYPSARLFRQKAYGDWQSVVTDVAGQLMQWLASHPTKKLPQSSLAMTDTNKQQPSRSKKTTAKKAR